MQGKVFPCCFRVQNYPKIKGKVAARKEKQRECAAKSLRARESVFLVQQGKKAIEEGAAPS